MDQFNEVRFREQVERGLIQIKKILDKERSPTFPADVPHQYGDKYVLSEMVIRAGRDALQGTLGFMGLTAENLETLKKMTETQAITLRLKSEERVNPKCEEVKRQVEPTTQHETTVTGDRNLKFVNKQVTTVIEYHWTVTLSYEIIAFCGPSPDENTVLLQNRSDSVVVINASNILPYPEVTVRPSVDVEIGWILSTDFHIDRTDIKCATPRRNPPVEEAFKFFKNFREWCEKVNGYFSRIVFPMDPKRRHNSAISADSVFVPVLPLFEKHQKENTAVVASDGSSNVTLPPSDIQVFLTEQERSLQEKFTELSESFNENGFVTVAEAKLLVSCLHCRHIVEYTADGINYIEYLLRQSLIASIGKELGPEDFTEYMRFHNRKLFRSEFEPAPFTYAIRRPDHYPEGTLSIESGTNSANIPIPVSTTVRHIGESDRPMEFALNAATNVTLYCERYLHALVLHKFSNSTGSKLTLAARARQFSSFILMIGNIASANIFEPKAAIIIQNKDDLKIPLLVEQIPTPKEFQDAIESLSPEQQRFAKAYRAMQLESTLFGVCIIQIKPQLEKLLDLPSHSLTKEIKLTQDLLELFIKYQIPSDQIRFDGNPSSENSEKVKYVRDHADSLLNMIKESKASELKDRVQEFTYTALSSEIPCGPPPAPIPKCEEVIFKTGKHGATKKMMMMRSAPQASNVSVVPQAKEAPKKIPTRNMQQQAEEEIRDIDVTIDVSTLPALLDKRFLELDEDSVLRPTIITTGPLWERKRYHSLLAEADIKSMNSRAQEEDRDKAYDLLDALSRSGALDITEGASLHIIVAATHCFDSTLMNAVVQKNINPIEKVEHSGLIVASAIHGTPAQLMVKPAQVERLTKYSPKIMAALDV